MRNVHPTQAKPKHFPCPLQRDYVLSLDKEPSVPGTNMRLFTFIFLKAVTAEGSTLLHVAGTLPHHPPHHYQRHLPLCKTSLSKQQKKPLQANLLGESRPRWGLPGWGHGPGAPSAGRSCLIQKASSSFRRGVWSSRPAPFRRAVCEQSFSANDGVGSVGTKYNQEFYHPAAVTDMARWCVSTSVSVKAWSSWNKRKQIPSEFLLSKQRGLQWPNVFPGQYPTPVLQSHKAFISTLCKCSSGKNACHWIFLQLSPPVFHFFSFLSCSHALPLSYYNFSWLAATCHLLPCRKHFFSYQMYLLEQERLALGAESALLCQRDCQCLKTTAAHQKKKSLALETDPPKQSISTAGVMFIPWEKRIISFRHKQQPRGLGHGWRHCCREIRLLGTDIINLSEILSTRSLRKSRHWKSDLIF